MHKSFVRILMGSLMVVGFVACGGDDGRKLDTNGDVIKEISTTLCEKLKECNALGTTTVQQCKDAAQIACTGQNGMPPAVDCKAKTTWDKDQINSCLDGLEDLSCSMPAYPKGCPQVDIPQMPKP